MACAWSHRGHTFCIAKILKISKLPETKSYFRYLYVCARANLIFKPSFGGFFTMILHWKGNRALT